MLFRHVVNVCSVVTSAGLAVWTSGPLLVPLGVKCCLDSVTRGPFTRVTSVGALSKVLGGRGGRAREDQTTDSLDGCFPRWEPWKDCSADASLWGRGSRRTTL